MCYQHKPALDPQPSQERMKIVSHHNSATERDEIPHTINSTNHTISDALKRHAQSVDAGETIIDNINLLHSSEDRIEALADLICGAGEQSAAALLVLMSTLENATDPKALANAAKHLAFTRCGELNAYSMVDLQIAVFKDKLLEDHVVVS